MTKIDKLIQENRLLSRWYKQLVWTAAFFVVASVVMLILFIALVIAWFYGNFTVDCPLLTEKHCAISIDL